MQRKSCSVGCLSVDPGLPTSTAKMARLLIGAVLVLTLLVRVYYLLN
jgi:hypothetical protein